MALIVKDRVQEISTTVGTGTLTLGGAVLGFQSFAAIGNANTTYYAIVDPVTYDWEVGIGTYTSSGTTLSRTTVLSSSNGGTLVNFAAGTKNVFCTYPSERSVYRDTADTYTVQQAFDALTANSIALTTGTITTAPTSNTDIVNKQYADAIASGIHFHEAVAYATTAALPASTYNNGTSGVGATLTGNANGALTVDSYTFTSPADNGTRILIKNQANGAENGVYTLTQAGNSSPGAPFILTRATDFDSVGTGVDQIDEGDFFLVTGGTANINTAWVQQTAPPITIGTTAIVFQQFSAPITYTAGTGLSESPTYTFNIANTGVTAATYGSASQVPVFAVNAQGQLTSVTNTAIAIAAGAVSGLAASATTDTTNANNITSGSLGTSRLSGSYTGVTGVGTLTAGTWSASTIAATRGGTGLTSFTVGDLIYANSSTTLASLADVAVGSALISGGVGADPSWGKIGLATHVSGTLPVANGGTGITSFGTGVATALGINTGTAGAFVVNGGALGTPSSGTVTNLTGTASININGTVGATTPNTGAFTTLSATGVTTVQAGTVSAPAITTSGDTNTGIFFPAADTIAFAEGGVEAMRIDSSANVGINTSALVGGNPVTSLTIYRPTAATNPIGSPLNPAIRLISDASEFNEKAEIQFAAGGAAASGEVIAAVSSLYTVFNSVGDAGGALLLSTRQSTAAGGLTERARISAAGGFSVGTTSDPGAGAINATGNITAFFSSDRTLKENIREIPDALNKACAIGGKLFDWTDDYIAEHGGEDGYFVQKADFGVIAQDVKPHLPEAVKTREDGTLAVDYEKLCALAFAAIAELRAEVDALKQ
jgi:hypothetical protein